MCLFILELVLDVALSIVTDKLHIVLALFFRKVIKLNPKNMN